MLKVHVGQQLAGSLFKSEAERSKFCFAYDEQCSPQAAVSLTMPVMRDQYFSDHKALHPVFDMNLPEGDLGKRLRSQFSKALPDFDDLMLLRIVGKSQIGRLRFVAPGEELTDVPTCDLSNLLKHDGADGLFDALLDQYAVFSGIAGVQPKVMVRAEDADISRITHRGATHIVKAWNAATHPQLAANEYFCMQAAMHAKLDVPKVALSAQGNFLIVERFDIKNNVYLGFEDFCVLNGKTSADRYSGSYENITKRIKDFVSPEHVRPDLESFFKALALSCAIKNGDAHLKNFGVLYDDTESSVRLSPIYDLVSTTPYIAKDTLALTLAGTKRWPKAKSLIAFARTHCDITEGRAKELLKEVADGIRKAADEMRLYLGSNASFSEMGTMMLTEWEQGVGLSIQPE